MHIGDQAGMPKIKTGGQELEVVERFALPQQRHHLGQRCRRRCEEPHWQSLGGIPTNVKYLVICLHLNQHQGLLVCLNHHPNIKVRWYALIIIPIEIYASERCKASASITRKVDVLPLKDNEDPIL